MQAHWKATQSLVHRLGTIEQRFGGFVENDSLVHLPLPPQHSQGIQFGPAQGTIRPTVRTT